MNVWTKDPSDKPRMELTFRRNPGPLSSNFLPSLMFDMETVFSQSLLFSYYSKECSQIAEIKADGIIDLVRTKQDSVRHRRLF